MLRERKDEDMPSRMMVEARERIAIGWCQVRSRRTKMGAQWLPRAPTLDGGRFSAPSSQAGTGAGR